MYVVSSPSFIHFEANSNSLFCTNHITVEAGTAPFTGSLAHAREEYKPVRAEIEYRGPLIFPLSFFLQV